MDKTTQDLAWSVLPIEFKEEVKKEYKHQLCIDNEQAYWMLERIFGKHNLTSDAEGEEMLTVSRKQVQEMYADIINDIRDYNGENPEMVGTTDPILRERAAGMKAQLHILFGSKCLPDEACNIASSDVASSEPKPAEPKFKHGDMVIYKRTGKKKVVSGTDKYGRYIVVLPNKQSPMYVDESDLEPYTEPTEKIGNPDFSNASKSVRLESDSAAHVGTSNETVDRDHNRLRIAAMAMQGLLSNPSWTVTKVCRAKEVAGDDSDKAAAILIKDIAEDALGFADALFEQCEKGGEK